MDDLIQIVIMDDLLNIYFKLKLMELLDTIQSNYSQYITKKDVETEIIYIMSKLKCKKISNNEFESIFKIKKKKKKLNKKEIPNEFRCEGRVWGPIKSENEKEIYGNRCRHKKTKNSKYCYIHNYKLTHGNFLEPPSRLLMHHFKKNPFQKVKRKKT